MFEIDDEDFTLSPSSKLSAIFNSSIGSDGSNASLNYKAPKQPRPPQGSNAIKQATNIESQTSTQSSSVIVATPVTLWKLENGSNVSIGKYMAAIIGHLANDIFEIIIYQDKTKMLVREALGKSLIFYKYSNNFVAFHDKAQQLWNLNFDRLESADNFLQYASKYNCMIVNKVEESQPKQPNDINNSLNNTEIASVVPSLPSNENSKQKILSRITKLGKQILPRGVERTNSSELSDSETESSCSDSRLAKPVITPRKFKRATSSHEKSLAPIVHENPVSLSSQGLPNNNFLVPKNQMVLNPHNTGLVYSHPLPDYGLSNFIVAQNAELKANLAEINSKLNSVIMSSGNNNNGNSIDDNTRLTTTVKCQNLKIDNLSNDLEKSKKALESLQKKFEETCQELAREQSRSSLLCNVQLELQVLQEKAQELECLKDEVIMKDEQLVTYNSRLQGLELDYKESEAKREKLKKECQELKASFAESSRKKEQEVCKQAADLVNVSIKKEKLDAVVKGAMSEVFSNIMDEFDGSQTYDFKTIQGVLSKNLKRTSYSLMNSLLQASNAE